MSRRPTFTSKFLREKDAAKRRGVDSSLSALNSSVGFSGSNTYLQGTPFQAKSTPMPKQKSINDSQNAGMDTDIFQNLCTTNITCLLEENPEISSAGSLYPEFLKMLQNFPHDNQVLNLVGSFHELCSDTVQLLQRINVPVLANKTGMSDMDSLYKFLNLEKHTWALLLTLYKDRFETEAQMDGDMHQDYMEVKHSERDVIKLLYDTDAELREAQLITDWLEGIANERMVIKTESEEQFAAHMTLWEHTRYYLDNTPTTNRDKNIISNLNPDSPFQGQGKLVDTDKQDEDRFLAFLFICIRAGDLEKAKRLCIESGQSWRAVTLEGWRLHHNPGLTSSGETTEVEGNPNRRLYKAICWRTAQAEYLSTVERAIYASLSGNLDCLLNVCHSWEDVLWAHLRSMIESRVDVKAQTLTDLGPFRTQSVMGPLSVGSTDLPEAAWSPGDWSLREVLAHTEACLSGKGRSKGTRTEGGLMEGDPRLEVFRAVQRAVILSDVDGVIQELHGFMNSMNRSDPVYKHMLRFMSHVVLFFRKTHANVESDKFSSIIENYVETLIDDGDIDLIAFYVAKLPADLQVQWYAKFLEGIKDREERLRCLELGTAAALNIPRITSLVVSHIRNSSSSAPTFTGREVSVEESLDSLLTPEELDKVHAIDWLVFVPSHLPEALRQANSLCRLFLVVMKINGAKEVIKRLPADVLTTVPQTGSQIGWHNKAGREHHCLLVYIEAEEAFIDWVDHFHKGRPQIPPPSHGYSRTGDGSTLTEKIAAEHREREFQSEMDRWKHVLDLRTKAVSSKIRAVLEYPYPGWLVDEEAPVSSGGPIELAPDSLVAQEEPSRQHQLRIVRVHCIQNLTFQLIRVLLSAGHFERCQQVVDIIASEEHKHYKLFQPHHLEQLLSRISEASVQLLDNNPDAL